MDTPNLVTGLIIGGVIRLIIGNASSSNKLESQIDEANSQCEIVKDDYSLALERANTNIDDANGRISEARDYAGSSYDDMGSSLENLEDIESSDDPQTSCD